MLPKPDERPRDNDTVVSLYREFGADLRRFLLRNIGSPDRVDDLVQQILLVLSRLDLAHVQDRKAYVFRTACRLLSRFRKRQAREAAVITIDSEAMEAAAASPSDVRSDPVIDSFKHQDLYWALEQLPRQQRAVVELSLDGLSYVQIAERLSMSPASIGSTLTRARYRIAQLFWGNQQGQVQP